MRANTSGSYGTMYYVDDMAQAQAFYRTVLGVEPRYESAEWTEFDLGDGSALCLHAVERGKRPTEAACWLHGSATFTRSSRDSKARASSSCATCTRFTPAPIPRISVTPRGTW